MKKTFSAVCFGEILWDIFPNGKTLGGAPLNVALRLLSLKAKVNMISKLGTDPLAQETLSLLDEHKLNTQFIQEDSNLETGKVNVAIHEDGNATYTIKTPVAWDAIALTETNKEIVAESDLFIFGSLAARNHFSRDTLKELISVSRYSVFDLNLRAPYYNLEQVVLFMKKSQFIKMNEEELQEVTGFMGISTAFMEEKLEKLAQQTETKTICITCGDAGAALWQKGKFYSHPGYSIKVKDTVGAGDSFLAGLLYQLQQETHPQKALGFACALGALVASKKGANPVIAPDAITELMES